MHHHVVAHLGFGHKVEKYLARNAAELDFAYTARIALFGFQDLAWHG